MSLDIADDDLWSERRELVCALRTGLLQKPVREELVTFHRGEGQSSLAREIGCECLNNLLVLRGLAWRRGRNQAFVSQCGKQAPESCPVPRVDAPVLRAVLKVLLNVGFA